jgi:cytochrome P450
MAGTSSLVTVLAIGLLSLLFLLRKSNKAGNSEKPLLKLPLIGDLHSSPIDKPLANWDSWARRNGPIAVPKLFGVVPIVVLNSFEAVSELFSRRSQWYSNRPASVSMEMITDAQPGQSKFTLMHDYDDHLKLHHRLLSPSLGAPAAPKYQPLMELEAKQLLSDLSNMLRKFPDRVSTEAIYPLFERAQSSVMSIVQTQTPTTPFKFWQEAIGTTSLDSEESHPSKTPTQSTNGFASTWQQRSASSASKTTAKDYLAISPCAVREYSNTLFQSIF